ncbi:MAG: hypothetical protein KIT48_06655 [Pseudolabrys sp.]|nr:hypothetical protein [Pseudolabrys sp.]
MPRLVRIPTAKIGEEISDLMIGLARLTVHGRIEDALCAGSGTLVTIGRLDGLLTAAHVLEKLPTSGEVGIVLYRNGLVQKQTIRMEYTDQVSVAGDSFGPNGPDIGFLRLPQENVGWLKATNTFYNVSKRRDDVLASQAPAPNHVDAVVGMVDELTKEIPAPRPKMRAMAFSAIIFDGIIESERFEHGFDILEFSATTYPDFPLPSSFAGVSGGALWRIYFTEQEGAPEIVAKRLLGVPFYESPKARGMQISCHGPLSVYGRLYDLVAEKWPSEIA